MLTASQQPPQAKNSSKAVRLTNFFRNLKVTKSDEKDTNSNNQAKDSIRPSLEDESRIFTSEMFDKIIQENHDYLYQPNSYLRMIENMAHFNCGVIMFKHRLWDNATRFWKLVKSNGTFKLQIPLVYNLALVHFLNGQLDASLNLCQNLVRLVCIYLTEESKFQDQGKLHFIEFISADEMIKKISLILNEHIKTYIS